MTTSPNRAAFGRRLPARLAAVSVLVTALALASPLDAMADPPGSSGVIKPAGNDTIHHTNEAKIFVFPAHCCDFRFNPGTIELAPSAEAALTQMARLQSAAPARRNTVRLVVLADPKLPRKLADEQAAGRANTLRQALVAAGIPAQKVEVYPATPKTLKLPLSYPPIR